MSKHAARINVVHDKPAAMPGRVVEPVNPIPPETLTNVAPGADEVINNQPAADEVQPVLAAEARENRVGDQPVDDQITAPIPEDALPPVEEMIADKPVMVRSAMTHELIPAANLEKKKSSAKVRDLQIPLERIEEMSFVDAAGNVFKLTPKMVSGEFTLVQVYE